MELELRNTQRSNMSVAILILILVSVFVWLYWQAGQAASSKTVTVTKDKTTKSVKTAKTVIVMPVDHNPPVEKIVVDQKVDAICAPYNHRSFQLSLMPTALEQNLPIRRGKSIQDKHFVDDFFLGAGEDGTVLVSYPKEMMDSLIATLSTTYTVDLDNKNLSLVILTRTM